MRRFILSLSLGLFVLSCAGLDMASAQSTSNLSASIVDPSNAPSVISYQGVLARDGVAVPDGDYTVTVTLYHQELAGYSSAWSGTYGVRTSHGVFNVLLGSGDYPLPSPPKLDGTLFVGVKIGEGAELPLTRLASAVSAMNVADGSITSEKMGTDYIGSISINGLRFSTRGGDVNIITGDGMLATVDQATNSIVLSATGGSSSSNGKGANAETLNPYINNSNSLQTNASFNIDGSGQVGTTFTAGGNINSGGSYMLGGNTVLANPGAANIFVGQGAGAGNTTGGLNSFIGYHAGSLNNKGNWNTFTGSGAGSSSTTGSNNTFSGSNAGINNTTGGNNTALGSGANMGSTNLTNATAIGANAYVTQNNSLVLGSINGVNGGAASTNVGIGTTAPAQALDIEASKGNFGNVQFAGALMPGSIPGTVNQVLTSQGANKPPVWQDPCTLVTNCLTGSGIVLTLGTGCSTNMSTILNGVTTTNAWTGCFNTGHGYSALSLGALVTGRDNTAMGASALQSNTSGIYNVAVGAAALAFNATGGGNTAVGGQSLLNNTVDNNTAVGAHALLSNTTGTPNTALGEDALETNTTGSRNTAVGTVALNANLTTNDNTAVGNAALKNNTADDNTAVGSAAMIANTFGIQNTAVGQGAMSANTIGFNNTAGGERALESNFDGIDNTAFGLRALGANVHGNHSTAVGLSALTNSDGGNNTGVGTSALFFTTTGGYNTAIGENAGQTNTSGTYNTLVGNLADVGSAGLTNATAIGANAVVSQNNSLVLGSINGVNSALSSTNVGIGTTAPAQALDVEASKGNFGNVQFAGALMPGGIPGSINDILTSQGPNTAPIWQNLCKMVEACLSGTMFVPATGTGCSTNMSTILNNVTTTNSWVGCFNTGHGWNALSMGALVTGRANTAEGASALQSNTSGIYNVAVGAAALAFNATGGGNTAVGGQSLLNNTVDNNTAVGAHALVSNTTGTPNTAVGIDALYNNTIGYDNAAMGADALYQNVYGRSNVAVGDYALFSNIGAGGSDEGSFNVAVGVNALKANLTGNHNTAVGTDALTANTAWFNTGLGEHALFSNIDGTENTASGAYALQANNIGGVGGNYNTANGFFALFNNTTGSSNTAMGWEVLLSNVTGSGNVAMGDPTLANNTSGNNNTAVGESSMNTNVTGSGNTVLGANADVASDPLTNATAIGANAQVGASNSMVLGSINGVNGATANTYVGIGTTKPYQKLEVDTGIVYIDGPTPYGGPMVVFQGDATISHGSGSNGSNGDWGIEYHPAFQADASEPVPGLNFWKPFPSTNSGNSYLFLSDGLKDGPYVGVNNGNPSQRLEVSNGNVLLSNNNSVSSNYTGNAGQLQFQEPNAGPGKTTFQAGNQGGTTINYTLPTTPPKFGQILSSDASGKLYWVNPCCCPFPMDTTIYAANSSTSPYLPYANQADFSSVAWNAPRTGIGDANTLNEFILTTLNLDDPSLPCNITSAVLTIQCTPTGDIPCDDDIVLTVPGGNGNSYAPSYDQRVYPQPCSTASATTVVFNITGAALTDLNTYRRVSFEVEDDTEVLSATLVVKGCCLTQ